MDKQRTLLEQIAPWLSEEQKQAVDNALEKIGHDPVYGGFPGALYRPRTSSTAMTIRSPRARYGDFRRFNTSGLCKTEKHYMIDPLKRFDEVEDLIHEELYFTIHAPRQTGKTTYLHALAQKLNREANYITLVTSFERAGLKNITIKEANAVLIDAIYHAATLQLKPEHRPPDPNGNISKKNTPDLFNYLREWCESQEKPVVLLIDEIDALMDEVLISLLRQFRDGYQTRPVHFPASIALVGLRDVRDYKICAGDGTGAMGTPSPFNIKSDSLFMLNFTREDVFELLDQHGKDTGQFFPPEVKEEMFRLSNGQPWLVNALARQIIAKILKYDFSRAITPEILGQAKYQLIMRRDTHLDSLVDKLKEDRVKNIVQAIINGDATAFEILDDDISYVRDLGIICRSSPLRFANPIYAEIIPRVMATPIQEFIPREIQPTCFVDKNNLLDIKKILLAFQEFYRENAEAWLNRFQYKESAHHLLLMAFLQRVVNSGGEIIREMAVGNGRIDLLVKFRRQRLALELKINRGPGAIDKAKGQLKGYLDRLGLKTGYLVIFDPEAGDWESKHYYKKTTYKGKTIFMLGV